MPIIYTYPSATPTGDDLLIFSDVSNLDPNKATRKCTISDLVALIPGIVPGAGTVTSVGLDFGTTGLLTSGGTSQTITGAGTFTVTGTLNVDNGGTERSPLTQHAILVGDGTSPVQMIGPLTNGQLLVGSTGSAPVAASLTAGSGVSITPGAGSITIAATGTTYTAGDGLDLTGTTFSTDLRSNGGLVINTTELQVDLGATDMANHLAVSDGGTGQTTYVDGQVLIGNSTGNTLNKATLTAGSNISITNGGGSITIASTAITAAEKAFSPFPIYQGEAALGTGVFSIWIQSVVDASFECDSVKWFHTGITTGSKSTAIAVYTGTLLAGGTQRVLGTKGSVDAGINTITFPSSYEFTAGENIVIYYAQQAAGCNPLGITGILNNANLATGSASYIGSPNVDLATATEGQDSSVAVIRPCLHFYKA